jgi:hypothetical protein
VLAMTRCGLTFQQCAMVHRAAARMPPEDREGFARDVAARIRSAAPCTDDAVEIAIGLALHPHEQEQTNDPTETQDRRR